MRAWRYRESLCAGCIEWVRRGGGDLEQEGFLFADRRLDGLQIAGRDSESLSRDR